eukprot:766962-Hanusia_phi.AAC.1
MPRHDVLQVFFSLSANHDEKREEKMRIAQHSTAQHSTAQHSTAQHSTAQHSTAQHSTAQHSTAQHSTGWDRTGGERGTGQETNICITLTVSDVSLDFSSVIAFLYTSCSKTSGPRRLVSLFVFTAFCSHPLAFAS